MVKCFKLIWNSYVWEVLLLYLLLGEEYLVDIIGNIVVLFNSFLG